MGTGGWRSKGTWGHRDIGTLGWSSKGTLETGDMEMGFLGDHGDRGHGDGALRGPMGHRT